MPDIAFLSRRSPVLGRHGMVAASQPLAVAAGLAILARGDSEEPMDLYRRFMGREPSVDPLLARAGLLTAAAG